MNEIWKTIPGYNDYQVSNLGRVKSLKGWGIKERIMPGTLNSFGYLAVGLSIKGKQKIWRIHQLVALAFLDHVPNRKTVVDHINGIKTDNRLENLRIISNRKNTSLGYLKKETKSKYTGVGWHSSAKKWYAAIHYQGKRIKLGYFDSEDQAGQVYQEKLKELNATGN